MERNKIFWLELSSDIKNELSNIDKLEFELRQIKYNSPIFRRAKSSIIHDFYNCCERIFRKISTNINGEFEESEKWHKELLSRMTIPIKNIRPQVISEKLAAELDDYLSFRHIFRNIYGFELEGERLDRLGEKFEKTAEEFKKEINEFLKKIKFSDKRSK